MFCGTRHLISTASVNTKLWTMYKRLDDERRLEMMNQKMAVFWMIFLLYKRNKFSDLRLSRKYVVIVTNTSEIT